MRKLTRTEILQIKTFLKILSFPILVIVCILSGFAVLVGVFNGIFSIANGCSAGIFSYISFIVAGLSALFGIFCILQAWFRSAWREAKVKLSNQDKCWRG